MDGTFLEAIRAAHDQGDLSKPGYIKQALLYENFIDSSPELRGCLERHALWPRLDPGADAPGRVPSYSAGSKPPFADCAHPRDWEDTAERVARLELLERTITRSATPQQVDILTDERVPARTRKRLFAQLCEHDFGARPLLWVFEPGAETADRCSQLVLDLGLYHALGQPPRTRYLLFEMEVKCRRKPTWADAELAWCFDVAPRTKDHGWTRSLASGKPAHREWVVTGDYYGNLVDVLLVVPRDIPSHPPTVFWEYHRTRLEQQRASSNPAP